MDNAMEKYKESLKNTPGPIKASQIPQIRLDLRGLMAYAEETGRKVADLTEEEKGMFVK